MTAASAQATSPAAASRYDPRTYERISRRSGAKDSRSTALFFERASARSKKSSTSGASARTASARSRKPARVSRAFDRVSSGSGGWLIGSSEREEREEVHIVAESGGSSGL